LKLRTSSVSVMGKDQLVLSQTTLVGSPGSGKPRGTDVRLAQTFAFYVSTKRLNDISVLSKPHTGGNLDAGLGG
jgi:hypothetical protein